MICKTCNGAKHIVDPVTRSAKRCPDCFHLSKLGSTKGINDRFLSTTLEDLKDIAKQTQARRGQTGTPEWFKIVNSVRKKVLENKPFLNTPMIVGPQTALLYITGYLAGELVKYGTHIREEGFSVIQDSHFDDRVILRSVCQRKPQLLFLAMGHEVTSSASAQIFGEVIYERTKVGAHTVVVSTTGTDDMRRQGYNPGFVEKVRSECLEEII